MNLEDAIEIEDLAVQITDNYDGVVDGEDRRLPRG
jgi:hypothetical protein